MMNRALVAAAAAILLIAAAHATDGGDVAGAIGSDAFSCAVNNGWEFVIVRSYHNYGTPDGDAPGTLAAAASAGIQYRDVYHFPCAGTDPTQQVQDDINAVGASNFGQIWFDIETNPDSSCAWSSDTSANCNFLGSMISAASAMGKQAGVYSSAYMWSSIMGDSCTVGSDNGAPLWYAHYDDSRSFGDFNSFGGWTTPSIKQYNDQVDFSCGLSADADWYP